MSLNLKRLFIAAAAGGILGSIAGAAFDWGLPRTILFGIGITLALGFLSIKEEDAGK